MIDAKNEDQVIALRKILKDARTGFKSDDGPNDSTASTASGNPELNARNESTEARHGVQSVSGQSIGAKSKLRQPTGSSKQYGDSSGSASPGNLGVRRTARRLGENNSQNRPDGINLSASATGRTASAEIEGSNLVSIEPPPARFIEVPTPAPEIKEIPRPIKPTAKADPKATRTAEKPATQGSAGKAKTSGSITQTVRTTVQKITPEIVDLKSKGVLTSTESKALLGPLTQVMLDDFGYIDDMLWGLAKDMTKQPIWSDADEEDCQLLASLLIKKGQTSAVAATMVREMVNLNDYAAAFMLVAPRIKKTAKILAIARNTASTERKARNAIRTKR